jgi:hypothetical protein
VTRKRLKKKKHKKWVQDTLRVIPRFFSELAEIINKDSMVFGNVHLKVSRQGAMSVRVARETIYHYGKRRLQCICDECTTKRKERAKWEWKADPISLP